MTNDDEVIREIIKHREASIRFFGESGKQDRERQIFRAFIRCLGLSFRPTEIKSVPNNEQFPDIEFRDARFELKEMLDTGRKRHEEYKEQYMKDLVRLKTGKIENPSDLIEVKECDPIFLTFEELGLKIAQVLDQLCREYGRNERASTNLLMYFNFLDSRVDPKMKPVPIALDRMEWRSVSVVGSRWCYVFESSNDAPLFITEAVGRIRSASGLWDNSAQ